MIGDIPFDPEYVAARRVLLDVLEALDEHRKSIILVGAQAIYLRIGESDLAVAPYTTDGDLAIDPRSLADKPRLSQILKAAGFHLTVKPGTWTLMPNDGQVDLLVPAALVGKGRRGARLGPHGNEVARKATGLEAAIIDHSILKIRAIDPKDPRTFDVAVAGAAASLVAKVHKIGDRLHGNDRLQDKDALDVLRILRHCTSSELATSMTILADDAISEEVSTLR